MKTKKKFADLVPVGINASAEKNGLLWGYIASAVFSLVYLIGLSQDYNDLFEYPKNKRILIPGAIMPDFKDILGVSLYGFLILAIAMIPLAIYHYSYHFQGSKSIYLMKRLPDRHELAKRCFTVPLIVGITALATAFLLLVIYYNIYLAVTPEECLSPDQWQKLWKI